MALVLTSGTLPYPSPDLGHASAVPVWRSVGLKSYLRSAPDTVISCECVWSVPGNGARCWQLQVQVRGEAAVNSN